MKHDVFDGTMLCFVIMQLVALVLEQLFFLDADASYHEVEDSHVVYVDSARLQIAVVVNCVYMLVMLLVLVCDMAQYKRILFYVMYCLNASTRMVYLICAPIMLVSCTLLLSQPYIQTECSRWGCVPDYLIRTFRYTFGLTEFRGLSDYLILWPQAIVYLCVAVFTLNFGVAILTQQIALLQETVEFRQAMLVAYIVHQFETARRQVTRLLLPARVLKLLDARWSTRALVLTRLRVRAAHCGDGSGDSSEEEDEDDQSKDLGVAATATAEQERLISI